MIRLSVAGEAVNGFDVVRFRGLKRDTASALTATMAIAKERHRFEVHATGTLPILVLANLGLECSSQSFVVQSLNQKLDQSSIRKQESTKKGQ